jgi:hypothetical protein
MPGSVTAGDIILVGKPQGVQFAASGIDVASPTDTLGTTYARIPGAIPSVNTGSYVSLYIGVAPSTGGDVIATNGTAGFSGAWATEFSNVQPIFDTGVISKINSNSNNNTSAAITSPVAELLYSFMQANTASATVTINSPYTSDQNFTFLDQTMILGFNAAGAAGSNTAAYTVTSNTSNITKILLMGLRPTATGCVGLGGLRHRAEVY